jgi:hypothetical protein
LEKNTEEFARASGVGQFGSLIEIDGALYGRLVGSGDFRSSKMDNFRSMTKGGAER